MMSVWVLADALGALAQILFIVGLIPTVLGPDKPAESTAWMTTGASVLLVSSFVLAGMYTSAAAAALCLGLWATIGVQIALKRPG